MGAAIHDLTYEGKAVFRTIGSNKTGGIVGAFEPDVVEWAPMDEFTSLAASFDVGVVPLGDTKFNRAKSWLKGLEYAALGVPFISSPTQQYKELAALGMGDCTRTTTRNSRSWYEALMGLIEDEDYRKLRAEEGRILARSYTYEKHGFEWLQAWANALTLRRAT